MNLNLLTPINKTGYGYVGLNVPERVARQAG